MSSEDHTDFMVRFEDTKTAELLRQITLKTSGTKLMREALNEQDHTYPVSANTSLLIDAGIPKQSLILDEAYKLILKAQSHIVMTCQFFPNDTTALALKNATERGVKVTILYNHPSAHSLPFHALMWLTEFREKRRMPHDFFTHALLPKDHPYLHAKVLATDAGALIGSHNFVPYGVSVGTAEIALKTTDQSLLQQVHTALAAIQS